MSKLTALLESGVDALVLSSNYYHGLRQPCLAILRALRRGTDNAGSRRAYCVGEGNFFLSSYRIPPVDRLVNVSIVPCRSSRPSLRPLRGTFQGFAAAIRTTWVTESKWKSWLTKLFGKACLLALIAPTSMPCTPPVSDAENETITMTLQTTILLVKYRA